MPVDKVYGVSEITRKLRFMLEDAFPEVWVEGELCNYKEHTSGHIYFSLKDETGELRCVMFRSDAGSLAFKASDGMKVRVFGRITIYEKRGYYQLQAFHMTACGLGELALAFERLKEKLRAEGLFSDERKRPLPELPSSIGVVTARTGAAIHDILEILARRWPLLTVVLRPARVQGEGASRDIAEAIDDLNEWGGVDLIIVGRGGGSLEDLWAFNEEEVARAIERSRVPVVSAVGHEIDYTISDFVSDVRAPTPSAAAEIVVPDAEPFIQMLDALGRRAARAVVEKLSSSKSRLDSLVKSYGLRRPRDLILERWQNLDDMERRVISCLRHRLELTGEKLSALESRVRSSGPDAALSRGYCICRKLPGGTLVRRSRDLAEKDAVLLEFSEGRARCSVEESEV